MLTFALPLVLAQSPESSALVGHWQGSSEVVQGRGTLVDSFRFEFSMRRGKLQGHFTLTERKTITAEQPADGIREMEIRTRIERVPNRRETIRNIRFVAAEGDGPPAYRWFAAGDCWNVTIEGDQIRGIRNGGPCTEFGWGGAARLIPVTAHKRAEGEIVSRRLK
jgi:hypothetical protein